MDERIVKLLEPMRKHPGASKAALKRLRNYVGADLPADYLEFLRWSNGVSGVMPTPRQRIAALGGTGPEGILYDIDQVIDRTQNSVGRPGYLWLGAFNDSSLLLLLDTRSGDPSTMTYVLADNYWIVQEDEEIKPYRTASCYDLLDHLAAHEVYLVADLRGADLRGMDLSNVYFAESPWRAPT